MKDRFHLEQMMLNKRFEFGDRVRHAKRPEWGIGRVIKTEDVSSNGSRSQRLSVRFPGEGVKTLSTAHADLEHVNSDALPSVNGSDESSVEVWTRVGSSEWLAPVARRKIEEMMISLPGDVRDPFNSIRRRLAETLGLFRFDCSGRGLIEWAVAQTGLEDPLTRFSRHELEQYFDRWAFERDVHLGRLLQDPEADPSMVDELLRKAPPTAAAVARKHLAVR
jgi:hypothetical protein